MAKKPTDEFVAHPTADLFPLLDDEELAELAADIKARGLQLPIVLDAEGRILDGRNRARACAIAGVEPRTTVYDGDNPDMYVLSANAYRRHMSKGARAMVIGLVLAKAGKRHRGRWTRGSVHAATSGSGSIGAQRMAEVGLLIDHGDPDIIKRVANGDLPLAAAVELIQPEPAVEEIATVVMPESVDEAVERLEEIAATIAVAEDVQAIAARAADVVEQVEAGRSAHTRDVPNPAQRRERQAAREAADEAALAKLRPLRAAIERINVDVVDGHLRDLRGNPKRIILAELERVRVTIDNAIASLSRTEGE